MRLYRGIIANGVALLQAVSRSYGALQQRLRRIEKLARLDPRVN